MPFVIENRPSDSPLATAIWRTESGDVATFLSVACATSSIVFTCQEGRTRVTVRGPETRVTKMDCPADAEFFGIELRLGTFMPGLPLPRLVDDLCDLPPSGGRSFWLDGAAWDIPTYENADTFLERLRREQVLQTEGVVQAVLQDEELALSSRSVQRRFLNATGLTHRAVRQIERAREAARLLARGTPILDTVVQLGYADQPHLTRALKRFAGQTPAQLLKQPVDMSRL
jgi:hypothetical protein